MKAFRVMAAVAACTLALTLPACDLRQLGSYEPPNVTATRSVPPTSNPPDPAPSDPAPSTTAPSVPTPSPPVPSQPAPTSPAPSQPAPTEPTPTQPADPPRSAPRVTTVAFVKVAKAKPLGRVLTNSRGRTLYQSNRDSADPSRSRCRGACTKTWHPVQVTGPILKVKGINRHLLGTVKRAHGVRQLTVRGWPVYTFVHDHHRGDVKGQCLSGFATIDPKGHRITMQLPSRW